MSFTSQSFLGQRKPHHNPPSSPERKSKSSSSFFGANNNGSNGGICGNKWFLFFLLPGNLFAILVLFHFNSIPTKKYEYPVEIPAHTQTRTVADTSYIPNAEIKALVLTESKPAKQDDDQSAATDDEQDINEIDSYKEEVLEQSQSQQTNRNNQKSSAVTVTSDGDGDDDEEENKALMVNSKENKEEEDILTMNFLVDDSKLKAALQLRPQIYPQSSSKQFVNFRTSSCLYLCSRAKALGWKASYIDYTNMKFPGLLLIRWNMYSKYKYLTRTAINQVGLGSACIGGGKGLQVSFKCLILSNLLFKFLTMS